MKSPLRSPWERGLQVKSWPEDTKDPTQRTRHHQRHFIIRSKIRDTTSLLNNYVQVQLDGWAMGARDAAITRVIENSDCIICLISLNVGGVSALIFFLTIVIIIITFCKLHTMITNKQRGTLNYIKKEAQIMWFIGCISHFFAADCLF